MTNALFQAICRAGIFLICAQAIVHFRPREAYEKYMKLLVGIMILLQLFLPIGNFLLGSGMGKVADRLEAFRQELEQEMDLAAEEAGRAEEALERMTLEEVRRRMEEQAVMEAEGQGAQENDVEAGTNGEEISVEVGPIDAIRVD